MPYQPVVRQCPGLQRICVSSIESKFASLVFGCLHFIATLTAHKVFSTLVGLQFVTTLTANIEALSGSPVTVTIDSITAGSVKVASTTLFLSGDSSSAASYTTALTSGDTASVFGTSFGTIAVDTSSITTSTASNPSKLLCISTTKRLWLMLLAIESSK